MVQSGPISWQAAAMAWTFLDEFLTPIRIPLFFFISGYFAAKAVNGNPAQRHRAWLVPAYLYVLWTILLTLRLLVPGGDDEHSFSANLLGNLIFAGSGYWYLYALPLYFVYTHLTRSLPGWLAAVPLVAGLIFRESISDWAQSLSEPIMDGPTLIGSIAANGIFFWVGARFGRGLTSQLSSRPTWIAISVALGYSIAQIAAMSAGMQEWTLPLLSFIGIGVGVMLASRARAEFALSRALRYVGQRTLPVYVLQFFFISVLSLAWGRLGQASAVEAATAASWLYPLVVTALISMISLVAYRLAMLSSWTTWLFRPPSFLFSERRGANRRR